KDETRHIVSASSLLKTKSHSSIFLTLVLHSFLLRPQVISSVDRRSLCSRLCYVRLCSCVQLVLSSTRLRGFLLNPELLGVTDYFRIFYFADCPTVLDVRNRFAFA